MQTALITTGLIPLTVGSTQLFEAAPFLDGLPWDLSGGSASLILADPTGALTTIPATIIGFGCTAAWTVAAPIGTWVRAWRLTSADGITQYSEPITFGVISSPV